MEYEHDVRAIPINEKFPQEVEALNREGWQLIPNITPVAIYHVCRPKVTQGDVQMKLTIDDSKIGILRNGKLIG